MTTNCQKRFWVACAIVGVGALGGCELIASVDESKIPTPDASAAGGSAGSAGASGSAGLSGMSGSGGGSEDAMPEATPEEAGDDATDASAPDVTMGDDAPAESTAPDVSSTDDASDGAVADEPDAMLQDRPDVLAGDDDMERDADAAEEIAAADGGADADEADGA